MRVPTHVKCQSSKQIRVLRPVKTLLRVITHKHKKTRYLGRKIRVFLTRFGRVQSPFAQTAFPDSLGSSPISLSLKHQYLTRCSSNTWLAIAQTLDSLGRVQSPFAQTPALDSLGRVRSPFAQTKGLAAAQTPALDSLGRVRSPFAQTLDSLRSGPTSAQTAFPDSLSLKHLTRSGRVRSPSRSNNLPSLTGRDFTSPNLRKVKATFNIEWSSKVSWHSRSQPDLTSQGPLWGRGSGPTKWDTRRR